MTSRRGQYAGDVFVSTSLIVATYTDIATGTTIDAKNTERWTFKILILIKTQIYQPMFSNS